MDKPSLWETAATREAKKVSNIEFIVKYPDSISSFLHSPKEKSSKGSKFLN